MGSKVETALTVFVHAFLLWPGSKPYAPSSIMQQRHCHSDFLRFTRLEKQQTSHPLTHPHDRQDPVHLDVAVVKARESGDVKSDERHMSRHRGVIDPKNELRRDTEDVDGPIEVHLRREEQQSEH